MPASDTMEPDDARLDPVVQVDHAAGDAGDRYEKENHHHHGPEETVRALLAAATRVAGGNAPLGFGRSSQQQLPAAQEVELKTLLLEPVAPIPRSPVFAEGGEHRVFGSKVESELIKHTLPGFYGRIMDERVLLDPSTFLSKPKLAMRGALPSEYLRRWAVMADVFGMVTNYLGRVEGSGTEPTIAVSQTYIVEREDDPATLDDVVALMMPHGFVPVHPRLIVNPDVQQVTWYRQGDGLLITDAHARNFRKDPEGVIFPIDLVISIVPPGASALLPPPDAVWMPSFLLPIT